MAGTRTMSTEPPRSTAYYYADLEKIKRQNGAREHRASPPDEEELSEYAATTQVPDDGAASEVPPLRDRRSPEYTTPDGAPPAQGETYSTAGTFPMPEPREKEPLLAELAVVGRVPLAQLDPAGVRRSRSWYLCCPDVGDEEVSRESSWRYSSLRPVTAAPVPGQNGFHVVATQSSGRGEEAGALRAERDALARALAAERQRGAAAARAHDARLAELHGVIAELVRRRAGDQRARAIPEEELSDECESTTQPAGELDMSQTEQNDSSSLLSPELATPQDPKVDVEPLPDDDSIRLETPKVEVSPPHGSEHCSSLALSERDSEVCVSTERCRPPARAGSCERERGSPGLLPPDPVRCESRQAKLASRVRLRRAPARAADELDDDEARRLAEQLALDVCAAADLRELLADNDGAWRARCVRLAADCRVLDAALARALDTAHRLSCACALQESSSVALCGALRAADRALETYDVLLALAESGAGERPGERAGEPAGERAGERRAAEAVARRLLARLDAAPAWGEPLLSPGPWLSHDRGGPWEEPAGEWSGECEARLRAHAARLKGETAALRALRPAPRLYSPHDAEGEACCADTVSMAEMEAAVLVQELLAARDQRAQETARRRRHRERPWVDKQASETDL